mmetsp:Transcript_40223/g.114701  ORF Transcript_40223/g.114701 Transcript_40223/m.114701 type:complete len:250 (+) Transcript_40223:689-1438(+)
MDVSMSLSECTWDRTTHHTLNKPQHQTAAPQCRRMHTCIFMEKDAHVSTKKMPPTTRTDSQSDGKTCPAPYASRHHSSGRPPRSRVGHLLQPYVAEEHRLQLLTHQRHSGGLLEHQLEVVSRNALEPFHRPVTRQGLQVTANENVIQLDDPFISSRCSRKRLGMRLRSVLASLLLGLSLLTPRSRGSSRRSSGPHGVIGLLPCGVHVFALLRNALMIPLTGTSASRCCCRRCGAALALATSAAAGVSLG